MHHFACLSIKIKRATTLSEAVWSFKEKGIPYNTKWDIVKHGTPYKNSDLCTTVKVKIIFRSKDSGF